MPITVAETVYINAGTTYSQSTADTAPASDAVARQVVIDRQTSDSAPASDTVTRSYVIAPRTISAVGDIASAEAIGTLTTALKVLSSSFTSEEIIFEQPTFTRATTAYKKDGTQVASGVPRFEAGKFGRGLLIEETTTNLLTANQSNGGEDGTTTGWATSGTNTIASSTEQAWQGTRSIKATYQNDLRLANVTPAIAAAGAHVMTVYVWIPTAWDGGTIRLAHDGTFGASTNLVVVDADLTKRDQWQRISMSLTIDASDLVGALVVRSASAPTAGRAIYIDGVQVEAKSYRTSWQLAGAVRNREDVNISTGLLQPGEGSVEAWVQLDSLTTGTAQVVIDNRSNGTAGVNGATAGTGILVNVTAGGFWQLAYPGTSGTINRTATGSVAVEANRLYHVAATWGPSGGVLYVDGVQVASNVNAPSWNVASFGGANTRIGRATTTALLNGVVDDLRISSIARTASEITTSYNRGGPANTDAHTLYNHPFEGTLDPSQPRFGIPLISETNRFSPTSIPSAEAFGLTAMYFPGLVIVSSIASAEFVGIPTTSLMQRVVAQDVGIPSAEFVPVPLARLIVLPITNAGNIASAEAFGLTVNLTAIPFIRPTSIASAEAFGPGIRVVKSADIVFITSVPPYRVVITDLSDNAIEEVPFKNLQFTYALNDAGSCSFTLPILHEKCTKSLLDPGKRNVQVWREGVLVWGGRLWFANPTTGDDEVRFSAEGWFSILRRRFIDAKHFKIDADQLDIAWSLINFTQSKTIGTVSGNIGITRANPAEASGILRTRKYHAWERYNIADELVNLTEINNGFDFEITPAKSWITHFPQKGTDTNIVFELGKNIGNLSQSFDAANVATEFTALGAGDRNRRCIATVSDASQLAAFGILEANEAYSGIKHYDTLAAKAVGQLDVLKRLKRNPQLSVTTDEPEFTDYAPGDRVRVKANYGYLQVNELYRVTAQSIQIADSGRESQTVFMEETTV